MAENELHVVFGAGPAGLAVVDELLVRGKSVRLVNTRGKADVPDTVTVVRGDATDSIQTRRICEGASVVYNCTNAPYDRWPQMLPPLQEGILDGAAAAGAKLVVLENVYMYGPVNGKPMTEDMPFAAETVKGQTRAMMSKELFRAHDKGKVRVAIGRASDFFGPRTLISMMGERIFYPALSGKKARIIGKTDLPHTQTYIRDIGRGLVILGERDEADGQAWHLPSERTVTSREFIEMIYKETGHKPRIQAASKFMTKILGKFNPVIREMVEIFYQFDEPFIVDHSKFEKAFGNHATPLEEAIRDTVEWFRSNPAS